MRGETEYGSSSQQEGERGRRRSEEEGGGGRPRPAYTEEGVEGCGGERWEGTFQVETLWDPARDTPANFPQSFSPEGRRKGSIPRHSDGTQLLQSETGTLHLEWDTFLFWSEPKRLWAQLNFSHNDFRKHADGRS